MKVALVYDSVSSAKTTAKVAEAIAATLRGKGLEVASLPVEDAKHIRVEDYDALIVGTPTMAWAPTQGITGFLNGLKSEGLRGKKAASFDTQLRSLLSGNANRAMESRLKKMGFEIACPHLLSYVKHESGTYQLLDGEVQKAEGWAEGLADALLR
ncbi:MAG: hypothetical protein LLG21_03085 [Euryarchaeota archaeon]|nr:hypothetical protein [Euryarchaeota archaeon]